MGLFGYTPNISKEEFQRVMWHFRAKGWGDARINAVRMLFHGDMEESGDWRGIDAKELERAIKLLRENMARYNFTPTQINELEAELKSKL